MKVLIFLIVALISSPYSAAHSGRTDSNGGHNCSAKSQAKGLCSGYHYHGENRDLPAPPPTSNVAEEPQELTTEEDRRKVADWHIIYGDRDSDR